MDLETSQLCSGHTGERPLWPQQEWTRTRKRQRDLGTEQDEELIKSGNVCIWEASLNYKRNIFAQTSQVEHHKIRILLLASRLFGFLEISATMREEVEFLPVFRLL